jgi:hypothetical protein
MEPDDGVHEDGSGQIEDQVLQLEKEKREKQKSYGDQGNSINRILFCQSRHNRGCDWV